MHGVETGDPWAGVVPPAVPDSFEVSRGFWKAPSAPYGAAEPQADLRATRMQIGEGGVERPEAGLAYDIASVYVPRGSIGVCYGIQHSVKDLVEGVWQNYNKRDDPTPWQNAFPDAFVGFSLRIETRRRYEIPGGSWPWDSMPGVPHPDCGGWYINRFPWGSPEYRVRLLVPQDRWLRLYFYIAGGRFLPSEVGGRLLVLTSSYSDNLAALGLARAGW